MELEVAADVVPHPGRRRGRERAHHRAIRQAVHELLDTEIAGAEVLPPLADAVGLVHRHHADELFLREALEARHFQPLRGHIDDLIPALPGAAEHQGLLVVGEAVVEESRRHTGLHQRPHLVFHQADQRRHHDGDARQKQRRHLIADGFARTGGHHRQHILPVQQPPDDVLLSGAETVVAKNFFQDRMWVCHGCLLRFSNLYPYYYSTARPEMVSDRSSVVVFWQVFAGVPSFLCAKML